MSLIQDICRMCLQITDYQEVEVIDLQKLNNLITRPYLKFSFIRQWVTDLFQNHLICSTCLENFNSLKKVFRNCQKVNVYMSQEKTRSGLKTFHLTRLKRFRHLENDAKICRVCLEHIDKVAIYLYDNSNNILPAQYIEKMLRYLKIFSSFLRTINPVLCHKCWENIQVSFSFVKRLEMVTEKISYYQAIANKSYLDREDLHQVLNMWDDLGINCIQPKTKVVVKKEIKEEYYSELDKVERQSENLKSKVEIKKDYAWYHDHDYFGFSGDGHGENDILTASRDDSYYQDVYDDMPKLVPSVKIDYKQNDKRKRGKTKEVLSETNENKKYFKKSVLKKLEVEHGNTDYQVGPSILASYDEENPSVLETSEENKMIKLTPKKEKVKKSRKTRARKSPVMNLLRPRTRQSAKAELAEDAFSKDLLVLRKEEIIKTKKHKRTLNDTMPEYTSTPKINKLVKQNGPWTTSETFSKSNITSEYTFETLNLCNTEEIKKEVLEEEELQIKKEVVSENESDDHAGDNTEFNTNDTYDQSDECPNLESFIKSEPTEDCSILDLDEDEPPELEFQGLCPNVPTPNFTIQGSCTVDEKQYLINTVEEKREILLLEYKLPISDRCVPEIKSAHVSAGNKLNFSPPSDMSQRSTLKINNEKYKQLNSFIKVKEDLSKVLSPKLTDEEKCSIPSETKKMSEELIKFDQKVQQIIQEQQRIISGQSSNSIINPTVQEDRKIVSDQPHVKISTLVQKKPRIMMPRKVKNKTSQRLDQYDDKAERCPLCEFPFPNLRVVRFHCALHIGNSENFYYCDACLFSSLEYSTVIEHVKNRHPEIKDYENKRRCGACRNTIGQSNKYCLKCGKYFHGHCFSRDRRNCVHWSMPDIIKRKEAISVNVSSKDVQCQYCLKSGLTKWITCDKCDGCFHLNCIERHQKFAIVTRECNHSDENNIFIYKAAGSHSSVAKETRRLCKVCSLHMDRNLLKCKKCKKILHLECFIADRTAKRFGCEHLAETTDKSTENVSISNKEVTDVPKPKTSTLCSFCLLSLDNSKIKCDKCEQVFHQDCFLKDQSIKTFSCKHSASKSHDLVKEKIKPTNTIQGTHNITVLYEHPSTSKEVKKEILEELNP